MLWCCGACLPSVVPSCFSSRLEWKVKVVGGANGASVSRQEPLLETSVNYLGRKRFTDASPHLRHLPR